MTATLTTVEQIIKELYPDKVIQSACFSKSPLFALLPKNKKAGGKYVVTPVEYGRGTTSHTFSNAQSNASNTKYADFQVTRESIYGVATWSGELMRAAKGGDDSFLDAVKQEMDNAIKEVSQQVEKELFGDGSGALAQVAASPTLTGTSISFIEPEDVLNLEVGDKIVFSASKTVGASTGSFFVLNPDYDTNTIQGAATATSTTALTLNQIGLTGSVYLFKEGDQSNALQGLRAWCPDSAPSSGESFLTVDRSVNPTRLAGIRVDARGMALEEALIEGLKKASRVGSAPSHAFMSPNKWFELVKALGAKVQYVRGKEMARGTKAEIGFDYIEIHGGDGGPVKVFMAQRCPDSRILMVEMDMLELISLDEPVGILDDDGNKFLRAASTDTYEVRVGGYLNLRCKKPSSIVNVQID